MRTMQEVLLQPIEPTASLDDLEQELALLGLATHKGKHFVAGVRASVQGAPEVVGALLALPSSQVKSLEATASFDQSDSMVLRMCLGSGQHPFVFKDDTTAIILQTPPVGNSSNSSEIAHSSAAVPLLFHCGSQAKGGAKACVAGELKERRAPLTEYYPPATFDVEAKSNHLRSCSRLRMKIVKEIEDVCGHLYPSKEERDTILGGIQNLCGPPDNAPSWNIYWTTSGNVKNKHKGTSICDLERARRNPAAYSCHGLAKDGQMRPARPLRKPPTGSPVGGLPTGSPVGVGGSLPLGGQPPRQDQQPPQEEGGGADDDLSGLHNESELLALAAQKKAEVEKLQADAAAKKAKEKEDAKKRKDDEKAKKAEAAKENNKGQGGTKRVRRTGTQGPSKQAKKQAKSAELSSYEKQRKATIEFNEQTLAFIESIAEAGLKILSEDELPHLLGNKPTK